MAEALDPPFDGPDVGFNALDGWSWVGCYGGYYLQSDLLEGFEHGFFTRQWQGRSPDVLAGYLSAGVSVHRPQQIHSGLVLAASQACGEPWPEADGLVSDGGGQSLWVCGADCTPVLIADRASGRVAACHAGWRGVAAGIVGVAIRQLLHQGGSIEQLRVALGPAIGGDHYQVELPVVQAVAASLGQHGENRRGEDSHGENSRGQTQLIAAQAARRDGESGRWLLDIRNSVALQLQQLGFLDEHISICPLCTHKETLLFHSWRRDQRKTVQWSGIVSQA